MLLQLVFKDNFYRGDLHPGSILELGGGEALAVLDVGITGSLQGDIQSYCDGGRGESGQLFLENSFHECLDRAKFINAIS